MRNCNKCLNCHKSCKTCPSPENMRCNNILSIETRKKINHLSGMSSSQSLLIKRTNVISHQVGQSANPKRLLQAGGPGDLWHSTQKCSNGGSYHVHNKQGRTAYRNNIGVDKKHGSYDRYLARKIGGVLRSETTTRVVKKTTRVHQPRNRTGTSVCSANCGAISNTADKTAVESNTCYNNNCCADRMPKSCNDCNGEKCKGCLGNNTQGVATKCCKKKCRILN